MTGEISGIIKKNKGLCTLSHHQQGCIAGNSCILAYDPILPSAVNTVFSEPPSHACAVLLAQGPWRVPTIPAGMQQWSLLLGIVA